jgi:hypothetical protein
VKSATIGSLALVVSVMAVAAIITTVLFPVAFLHGPYCTVHGPLTDRAPEKVSLAVQLLILGTLAMLRKGLVPAPVVRHATGCYVSSPTASRANDRDLVVVHCASQR